jgi:hypothetical protein
MHGNTRKQWTNKVVDNLNMGAEYFYPDLEESVKIFAPQSIKVVGRAASRKLGKPSTFFVGASS